MKIRKLQFKDKKVIKKLGENRSIKKILKRIKNRNEIMLIAESGNEVIGHIDINRLEGKQERHIAELGIGILQKYRGKEIGSALMKEAIEQSRNIGGLEIIQLMTNESNKPAINLFKKFNFKLIAKIPKRSKEKVRYVAAFIMHKDLIK